MSKVVALIVRFIHNFHISCPILVFSSGIVSGVNVAYFQSALSSKGENYRIENEEEKLATSRKIVR